ncbi:hypothetical protein ACFL28_04385 [Candidatus Omnitrophota bacterium]
MLLLVKLLGIVIVVMGVIFLLSPKMLKRYISFWKQGKRLRIGGIINILFAIVFLRVASQCRLRGVITTLGIWSLIKGLALSTRGLEKAKSMLLWWDKRPPLAIRLIALLCIGIGALILYSI